MNSLDELGFIWDLLEADFQEELAHLKAYHREHGDSRVHLGFSTENGFRLGAWVATRRNQLKAGKIGSERIHALEDLDFIWNTVEYDCWRAFEYFKTYMEEHG